MAGEPKDKNGLTEKQRAFVAHYAGRGAEAVVLAGYNTKFTSQEANRLLKNPAVQAAIQQREHELAQEFWDSLTDEDKAGLSRDYLEMRKAAASREEVILFWSTIMRDGGNVTGDRLRASENLARAYSMFLTSETSTDLPWEKWIEQVEANRNLENVRDDDCDPFS